MNLKPDQKRVKDLLVDTIASLCRDGLTYGEDLCIQGVIGITVDKSEVFLVHINQEISASGDDNGEVLFTKDPPNKLNKNIINTSTPKITRNSSGHVKSEPRSPKSHQSRFNSPNYSPSFYNHGVKAIKLEDSFNSSQQNIQNTTTDTNQNDSEQLSQSSYYDQNASNNNNFFSNNTNNSQSNPNYISQMMVMGARRPSRRRGGRRGGRAFGRCSTGGRVNENFTGNTSWESMVATTFVCKVCGQTFVHKSNLLGHQIRIHGRQKNKRGRPPSQNNVSMVQQNFKGNEPIQIPEADEENVVDAGDEEMLSNNVDVAPEDEMKGNEQGFIEGNEFESYPGNNNMFDNNSNNPGNNMYMSAPVMHNPSTENIIITPNDNYNNEQNPNDFNNNNNNDDNFNNNNNDFANDPNNANAPNNNNNFNSNFPHTSNINRSYEVLSNW